MYHDVVDRHAADSSGLPGHGPNRYKINLLVFERHVAAIAATGRSPGTVADLMAGREALREEPRLYLTFDDGGSSALPVGERLAAAGWVGHFFVPVDFIGRPGFLDRAGVAALAAMGHVIGTHSCSHPVPMTRLSEQRLHEEWRRSVAVLSEIIEDQVFAGSVPGGYWSNRVVHAAATEGVDVLFTSDPVASIREREGCLLLGRYAILDGTSPDTAARLARGDLVPRVRQLATWRAKTVPKALLGNRYRQVRIALLQLLSNKR